MYCLPLLTLGGCFAVSSSQGDDTFVDLDANHHASFFEVLWEEFAIVGLLVHGLVEEDDATDARHDAVVSSEEELAVQPPVLLGVLSIDALEALGHTACRLIQKETLDVLKEFTAFSKCLFKVSIYSKECLIRSYILLLLLFKVFM